MIQRKFVFNLFLLLFLNLLIKPFWILGIDRQVQNIVGAESYGMYFTLFNFSFLFNIFLDLGITNFNNKNIAQNNHLLNKHFSSILSIKLILSAFYIVLTLLIAFCLGYDSNQSKFLFILSLSQVFNSMILYFRSNLSGLHLFKTDSVVSVLDKLTMIIVCAVILSYPGLFGKMSILTFAYSQIFALFITTTIAFIIVVSKAKLKRLNFNKTFTLMILKKSLPFAILVLLMTFYNRIDTVMLERLLPDGARQSGIYAQAFRLLDASNMIAYLFSVILLPLFARMIKHNENIEPITNLSVKLLVGPAFMVAIGCLFYSKDLMGLLYVENVGDSSRIFSILMFCFVSASTSYIFGTLLTANGSLKYLNIMAFSGMVLNITLNFILIPEYKAQGAAISSLCTQAYSCIVQIIMVHYIFKLKFNKKLWGTLSIFILGVIVFNVIGKIIFKETWMIGFALTIICCGFWAFAIKMFNVKSILGLLKSQETRNIE